MGGEGSSERFPSDPLVAASLDWFKGLACLDFSVSKGHLYWYTLISLALRRKKEKQTAL